MIFKFALKIMFLVAELFLGFYSFIMTDNLWVKFMFFTFSAVLVAFAILKFTPKILPSDIDAFPNDDLLEENYKDQ